MLDVHSPHEPVHGWRDFLLHIVTITIGLLIALGLEGLVEWRHHRHLVHEAEASLRTEIQNNARGMDESIADLHNEQADMRHDVGVLLSIVKNHKAPEHSSLTINFHIRNFSSVSWKTAQSTGALGYMPYASSEEYADLYATQDELAIAEQQAARDALVALGPLMNADDKDPDPTHGQAADDLEKVEVLEGQLVLVDTLFKELDGIYRKFLAAHPE